MVVVVPLKVSYNNKVVRDRRPNQEMKMKYLENIPAHTADDIVEAAENATCDLFAQVRPKTVAEFKTIQRALGRLISSYADEEMFDQLNTL